MCEQPLESKLGDVVLEVAILGRDRRVHKSCWRSIAGMLRTMPDGELLKRIVEREQARGIIR